MHDHALIPDTTKSHHLSHDPSGVRADRAHFVYEYKYGGFTWVLRTTENPLIHRTLYTRPCNTDSRVLHQAQTLHLVSPRSIRTPWLRHVQREPLHRDEPWTTLLKYLLLNTSIKIRCSSQQMS